MPSDASRQLPGLLGLHLVHLPASHQLGGGPPSGRRFSDAFGGTPSISSRPLLAKPSVPFGSFAFNCEVWTVYSRLTFLCTLWISTFNFSLRIFLFFTDPLRCSSQIRSSFLFFSIFSFFFFILVDVVAFLCFLTMTLFLSVCCPIICLVYCCALVLYTFKQNNYQINKVRKTIEQ